MRYLITKRTSVSELKGKLLLIRSKINATIIIIFHGADETVEHNRLNF